MSHRSAGSNGKKELLQLGKNLTRDFDRNSTTRTMRLKHDTLTVQRITPMSSKSITDEIDCVLAKHFGFTDEELDFFPSTGLRTGPSTELRAGINYGITYRMGQDAKGTNE